MADIVHLRVYGSRLNTNIISDIAKGTERGTAFMKRVEWLPVIGSMVLVCLLFLLVASYSHKRIVKMKSTDATIVRVGWQVLLTLACIFFTWGGFGLRPLSVKRVSANYNRPAVQLAATPFESLASSMPEVHN
jgi:protein-S-isoprenylcysteine O-methyltransferase Ste14